MKIRFYMDPATSLPHIYNHNVDETEVEEVLTKDETIHISVGIGRGTSPKSYSPRQGDQVKLKLKPISKAGVTEAIAKAEVYRYLNEPGEAESICRDILSEEPDNQNALRLLGLSITDQFSGGVADRYVEAENAFRGLTSEYERVYHLGILRERKAKAQLSAGLPPHTVYPIFEEALELFEGAEKISPPNNDEAILRWNRCVRLLQSRPSFEWRKEMDEFDASEGPPV